VITFQEIVDIFWNEHDPFRGSWSRQYRNVMFYHSEEQREIAGRSRDLLAQREGRPVKTEILPYNGFTLAEDYHQKHTLHRFPALIEEMQRIYSIREMTDSTAAARLNGYLAGYGSCDMLRGEIDLLGLSEDGKIALSNVVCGNKTAVTCTSGK